MAAMQHVPGANCKRQPATRAVPRTFLPGQVSRLALGCSMKRLSVVGWDLPFDRDQFHARRDVRWANPLNGARFEGR